MELTTIMQIAGFAITIMGCIGGTVMIMAKLVDRWLMSRFQDIGTRLDDIVRSINKDVGELQRVEHALMDLQMKLPQQYVLRDDYIRGQLMLEGKLDGLADRMANRRRSDEPRGDY